VYGSHAAGVLELEGNINICVKDEIIKFSCTWQESVVLVLWASGLDGMDRHFQLTNGGSRFI